MWFIGKHLSRRSHIILNPNTGTLTHCHTTKRLNQTKQQQIKYSHKPIKNCLANKDEERNQWWSNKFIRIDGFIETILVDPHHLEACSPLCMLCSCEEEKKRLTNLCGTWTFFATIKFTLVKCIKRKENEHKKLAYEKVNRFSVCEPLSAVTL